MVHWRRRLPVVLALSVLVGLAPPAVAQFRAERFAQIRGRSVAPDGMSGRVADVDVVRSNPNVIFVGSSTGGVWRSVDGGLEWSPIFDDHRLLGIGAVTASQATPDFVRAGTGEGNPRNSSEVASGVFRSRDGDDT